MFGTARPRIGIVILTLFFALSRSLPAQAADVPHSIWTTLGTMSGPVANPTRAQPANLLRFEDQTILIDAGDGTAEQLARARVPLEQVQTLIITHHHFDHIGGLFAILGMRVQTLAPGILTIYGPFGTKRVVDGLVAAMQPLAAASAGMLGHAGGRPADTVRVIEVTDGSKFVIGKIAVTVAVNTHYSFPPGSADAAKYQSLAYRFDMPDRSIAFTGDTGASANVERLAHNVDLLVSEIIDPEQAIALFKKGRPDAPFFVFPIIEQHMRHEHLPPEEVGLLAEHAGAKAVVLTHNGLGPSDVDRIRPIIAKHYKGPVTFAHDLDNF